MIPKVITWQEVMQADVEDDEDTWVIPNVISALTTQHQTNPETIMQNSNGSVVLRFQMSRSVRSQTSDRSQSQSLHSNSTRSYTSSNTTIFALTFYRYTFTLYPTTTKSDSSYKL